MSALDALNPKQRAFVLEYLKDHNASQAAIRAGYAAKNANVTGPRMLANVGISAAVAEASQEQEERTLVTADWIINNLKEVAERCLQKVPVMEFDKEKKQYVQATDGEGNGIWQFDSSGANRALELLGKYKKLFSDKLDLPDDAEVTYTVTMKT